MLLRRLGIVLFACGLSLAAAPPRTLRLDYIHAGSATGEHFFLDGVVLEGAWPGPPDRLIDTTNLGGYLAEVADAKTGQLLYSRGFASIFAEWEQTDEAKSVQRAFHESVRFPAPAGPVRVVLKQRDAAAGWRQVWSVAVDPADPAIDRSPPPAGYKPWAVVRNGEPADKVDVLLLGDGYTPAQMDKWHQDARRMAGLLLAASPFKERRSDFNVWAIDTPAGQSGISRPSDGVYRRSPLGASYDAFGSERYILAMDNKRLRAVAAAAPYEFLIIVANDRKYGGGGIFNLQSAVAADNAFAPYVLVHEFGHQLAGLADEYYTSDVAYDSSPARAEPWEPNVTADPKASKWADLMAPSIPLPTPWAKEEFERRQQEYQQRRGQIRARKRPEQEMEALFRSELDWTTKLLGSDAYSGKVGAFEGANYEARGYFRPQQDCIMFTRDEVGFCAVCRRAIEKVIGLYAGAAR